MYALLPCSLALTAVISPIQVSAQEPIVIAPLFEYPSAPDDIDGLTERSDYLMEHFWDSFDFSDPAAVDQNALNDAFNVYATAMRFAEKGNAIASVEKLVKKLKGNQVKLLQFTKSAEETLYGPRAVIWSDEVYVPFIKALTEDKKIPDIRKQRYAMQLELLNRNKIGKKFLYPRLTMRDGRHADFAPKAPLTLIEFGNPDCDDCQFSKIRLEMAADIVEMVENKELDIVFIVADAVPEDQPEILAAFKDYPKSWSAGICYGGDDIYDIRNTPSFYLLDKDGKILAKNIDVGRAVERIREISSKK